MDGRDSERLCARGGQCNSSRMKQFLVQQRACVVEMSTFYNCFKLFSASCIVIKLSRRRITTHTVLITCICDIKTGDCTVEGKMAYTYTHAFT